MFLLPISASPDSVRPILRYTETPLLIAREPGELRSTTSLGGTRGIGRLQRQQGRRTERQAEYARPGMSPARSFNYDTQAYHDRMIQQPGTENILCREHYDGTGLPNTSPFRQDPALAGLTEGASAYLYASTRLMAGKTECRYSRVLLKIAGVGTA